VCKPDPLPDKKIASIWEHVHAQAPKEALKLFDRPTADVEVDGDHEAEQAGEEHPWEQPAPAPVLSLRTGKIKGKPGPKPKPKQAPPVGTMSIAAYFEGRQAPKRSSSPALAEPTLSQPIAKRRRTKERVEGGIDRCKGCGEEVGGVHACDRCGAFMHIFCGTPIGEEGYGQKVRCPACC
jgi:hypothetical protein